jgi:hypothetical protein
MEKAKASSVDTAPQRKHAWSVLILAATAVLREGIESVIFLAGEPVRFFVGGGGVPRLGSQVVGGRGDAVQHQFCCVRNSAASVVLHEEMSRPPSWQISLWCKRVKGVCVRPTGRSEGVRLGLVVANVFNLAASAVLLAGIEYVVILAGEPMSLCGGRGGAYPFARVAGGRWGNPAAWLVLCEASAVLRAGSKTVVVLVGEPAVHTCGRGGDSPGLYCILAASAVPHAGMRLSVFCLGMCVVRCVPATYYGGVHLAATASCRQVWGTRR